MRILITGGTGFIGSYLCEYFHKKGFDLFVLTRNLAKKHKLNSAIKLITELNPRQKGFNVIINLAGEPLNQHRWNDEIKKVIYQSRIETTQKIIHYIQNTPVKPQLLISGSAIGFYGHHTDQIFTEASVPADEAFPHQLCQDWEKMTAEATMYGTRVCLLRMGIVLDKNGGILRAMLPLFKLGLGAILGKGKQWISWIHIDDVLGGVELLIQNADLHGPFNFTAPIPVTQKQFSQALAAILHRPLILRLPNFLVELIFGEMGKDLMLKGQKVVPKKLLEAGYVFKFSSLSEALTAAITK